MTHLGQTFPPFVQLNHHAFEELPLTVLNRDAFSYVAAHAKENRTPYDLIIVDLPDPHHESLAKLYSTAFYGYLKQIIHPQGIVGLQLGSLFLCQSELLGEHQNAGGSWFSGTAFPRQRT